MTDVIRNAAAKTTQIIEEAELAVRLLEARDFNRAIGLRPMGVFGPGGRADYARQRVEQAALR